MIWRITSALVVLFWAAMTGLVVRDAYFPDSSRFAQLPPRTVFEMFLTQAASFNNQLHLYHDREKIGHAHLTINKGKEGQPDGVYAILVTGSVEGGHEGGPRAKTEFQLRAELEKAEIWRRIQLQAKAPALQTTGKLSWKQGDELPEIEVKRGEEVVVNTAMLRTMMALQGSMSGGGANGSGMEWLSALEAGGAQGQHLRVELTAREGIMDLAGKTRRCFIVTASLLKAYEVNFLFTELGELSRIEMPGGYRFIEPLMHGLEPGLNTLQ